MRTANKSLKTWLIVLLALVAGCAGVQKEKQLNAFDEALRNYGALLRWGHYEEAGRYLSPRGREATPLDVARYRSIRVSAYEVTEKTMDLAKGEARVVASIDYYHEESGVVHTLKHPQKWWYDEATKSWRLDTDLPDFLTQLQKDR